MAADIIALRNRIEEKPGMMFPVGYDRHGHP